MHAAFDEFIAGLHQDFALQPVARPHAVRGRMRRAIACGDFCVQCARILLQQYVLVSDIRPFYADPHGRYRLQVFCWPPGFGNAPHRHETWTVAGVLTGSLLVFRNAASALDCRISAPLRATSGDVGVLIPPQFHCLRNDGDETAITLHLLSLDAAEKVPDLDGRSAIAPGLDDEDLLAVARMATERRGRDAADCIHVAFDAAGPIGKLELFKLMLKLDVIEAIILGRTLSQLVGGEDGRRLLGLIEQLEGRLRSKTAPPPERASMSRSHGLQKRALDG